MPMAVWASLICLSTAALFGEWIETPSWISSSSESQLPQILAPDKEHLGVRLFLGQRPVG